MSSVTVAPSIRITGTLLSAILYECANSVGDVEGFLTGSLATRCSEQVDDRSDTRVKTQEQFILIQGYYPLTPSTPKFYNWRGEIFPDVLEEIGVSSSLHDIVGYFKFRRQTRNQVSLREATMLRSLRLYLLEKGIEATNICIGIINAEALNPFMETHTYDYSFWTIGAGSDEQFEKVPVAIANIMESNVEYKSFISNFSDISQSSSLSLSFQQMIGSINPDKIAEQYEDMYTQATVALKETAEKVMESEAQIEKLRKEIEALEMKLENEDNDEVVALSRRKSVLNRSGIGFTEKEREEQEEQDDLLI